MAWIREPFFMLNYRTIPTESERKNLLNFVEKDKPVISALIF